MAGRPPSSIVRDNLVELLHYAGESYGYDLFKMYNLIFKPVSQRLIYYHLTKGAKMQIFLVTDISSHQGEFSWGPRSERKFYSLGKFAEPQGDNVVKDFFENHPKFKK